MTKTPSTPTHPNPTIVKAVVNSRHQQAQSQGRAERDAVRRQQVALREMERWDVARETRPHTPNLARDVLRADDAAATIRDEPTMAEAVTAIRVPAPRDYAADDDSFVDRETIQAARYLAVALTLLAAFFSGLALGFALA
ncbi:MAG TPA: hypothetical protein PLC99_22345 [Verrucomicrobiota bacterium]|nr:hypothetical protein [Verrucomicrobiota bacterium]